MSTHPANSVRYERKFLCGTWSVPQVEWLVKKQAAHFREIYSARFVNSIYYDTLDHENYFANLAGLAHRRKLRIRFYGELFGPVTQPRLEQKIRAGLAGYKRTQAFPGFSLELPLQDPLARLNGAQDSFPDGLRLELKRCHPVLLNRYRRRYFLSADGTCRVTVDSEMRYFRLRGHGQICPQPTPYDSRVVLELKYDPVHDREAAWIANGFPFRLHRFSKYVVGMDGLTRF